MEKKPGHIWCPRCSQYQPLDKWTPSKIKQGSGWCKPCCVEQSREWRKNNPERHREIGRRSHRKQKLKKYGLTPEDYDRMLDEQGGVCPICGVTPEEQNWAANKGTQESTSLAVDHCHKTGTVRGLLCGQCNIVLGHVNDDPRVLENMIAYLAQHSDN